MDTTEPTGLTHWDEYPTSAYEDFDPSPDAEKPDGDNEAQARAVALS